MCNVNKRKIPLCYNVVDQKTITGGILFMDKESIARLGLDPFSFFLII